MVNNCIYSSDMKTLYLAAQFNGSEINGYEILEGTEIIGKGAFEYTVCRSRLNINIPSSIVEIQTCAFRNIYIKTPTRETSYTTLSFFCKALIPPTLEENVFDRMEGLDLRYTLAVPKESLELYSSSTEWNQSFNEIHAINDTPPSNLVTTKCQSIVSSNAGGIYVISEKMISEICLLNLEGQVIKAIRPNKMELSMNALLKGIYVLSIRYDTGEVDILKVLN